jgi:acyl-coenzyme A thioesterase PaaI-like protein
MPVGVREKISVNYDNKYPCCFGCGQANPYGLGLSFILSGEEYSAVFVPRPEHQGYPGRLHGGIIASLLDEVMGDYVLKLAGTAAFTARLDIRYRKAVPLNGELRVSAMLIHRRGRVYDMKGELRLTGGALAAEATARILADEKKTSGNTDN